MKDMRRLRSWLFYLKLKRKKRVTLDLVVTSSTQLSQFGSTLLHLGRIGNADLLVTPKRLSTTTYIFWQQFWFLRLEFEKKEF